MSVSPIVDAEWLAANLDRADLIVLDASWYLPAAGRNADQEFEQGHIPGAQRFDFDRDVADRETDLPHMLPPPAQFEDAARRLGIDGDSLVVCYDGAGIFAAPRAWWMFKAMGHDRVVVLDGGMPAWRAAGGKEEAGAAKSRHRGSFAALPNGARLRNSQQVQAGLNDGSTLVVDARPPARFKGEEPEPRAGLRSGHMPGASNVPFGSLLSSGRYLQRDQLAEILRAAGVSADRPIVASCGSGVTAAVVALGLEAAGFAPAAVYDGSWAEWGRQDSGLPVVQGQ
jgi:thiosulfate/3-mercaptopyruvate sulfurtransferase